MTKQELKEKILKIIKANYFDDYSYSDDCKFYFDIDFCIDEIKKLFKEVE